MAIGIIGWDAEGQPMYGDVGGSANAGGSTIDPSTGKPRPVGAPNVPSSTIDPSTGRPRPVNPPAYNPLPALTSAYQDWGHEQDYLDNTYVSSLNDNQTRRENDLNSWESGVSGQLAQVPGIYAQQNADRVGNTAGLRSAYEGYNASDLAATNNFVNTNNANLGVYNQRSNDLYNTPAQMYTAQQWSSSPQDIQNQNQALGQFSDIYGGGLDYTAAQSQAAYSQAAYSQAVLAQQERSEAAFAELHKYASDPSDVNRQKQAIEQLKGLVDGGEWSDQMRDVTKKYKDLSDPEVTAQERYIMENFRQSREDQERVSREAMLSDLGARGLRSGAAEQTAMLGAQQELGRQGILEELGAEANAIGRSQDAMQGWSQASQAGRNSQLQASGMYVDAAGNFRQQNDNVGMFNVNSANQNSMFNAGQLQQNNQFNAGEANQISMYNAGLQTNNNQFNAGQEQQNNQFNANQTQQNNQFNVGQTNNAYANNQATRLSGATGYANQANAIRQSNDYVGTFNTGQQNLVGMQNQREFNNDLDRKAGLAQSQLFNNTSTGQVSLDAIRTTNSGNATRNGVIHTAQQGDIDSRTAGQLGTVGANITFEDEKLKNRGAATNSSDLVASTRYGVFTPTLGAKAGGKIATEQDKYRLYG